MAETTINPGIKWIAVVTGGNKGIGFEICRQLASNGVRVVLTARDVRRGNEAIEKLKAAGCSDVVFHQLDVMDPTTISSLADFIKTHFGKLDILVNNAGINGSISNPEERRKVSADQIFGPNAIPLKEIMKQTYQTAEDCLRTNYYGTKQVSEALIPLLLLSNSGRIVNVSSILGQLKLISNENAKKELGDVDDLTEEKVDKVVEGFLEDVKENLIETKGWPINISAYIVSKAALNAYTRVLARKYPKIAINSVHKHTQHSTAKTTMGRVRTKTVKKSSRQVIERYYSRMTMDFHTNKKLLQEVAIIPTKRLRNKIAGFSTHLIKRIQKGPVRGISLKLQEEERERRMDFVPDVSAINTELIEVDKETLDMLATLGMGDMPGLVKVDPVPVSNIQTNFGRPGGAGGPGRRFRD